jgi:hypothetical protein
VAEVAVAGEKPALPPPPAPEELLTVEAHPTEGRTERWRYSDGRVRDRHFDQVFVEK